MAHLKNPLPSKTKPSWGSDSFFTRESCGVYFSWGTSFIFLGDNAEKHGVYDKAGFASGGISTGLYS